MRHDADLRAAIAGRRLIRVTYTGRVRVLEPHDYGIRNGVAMLLGYQLSASGSDQKKPVRGWRMLDVSKIETCLVLAETFSGSRHDPSQRHIDWDELFARAT